MRIICKEDSGLRGCDTALLHL